MKRIGWLCVLGALGCDEDENEVMADAAAQIDGEASMLDARIMDAQPGADLGEAVDVGADRGMVADRGGVADEGLAVDQAVVADRGAVVDQGGARLTFGEACAEDGDCTPDLICRSVGMLGFVCTKECNDDRECPPGSMGQKCNQMGLCRP